MKAVLGAVVVYPLLGIARLAILTLPFRWLPVFYGRHCRNVEMSVLAEMPQVYRARRIGRLIERVAAFTPWESKCLVQATVAVVFLRLFRIPYVFYLGAAQKGEKGLRAHAWIKVHRFPVSGGDGQEEYAVVSTFLPPYLFERGACRSGA